MKWIFAPGMTIRSFIFIVSMAEIACWLITLIGTPLEGYSLQASAFLSPNKYVYHMFDKNPTCIACSF